jgi:phytoene desaturase
MRFMEKSREICRIGFEQLGDVPFSSPFDMARIAPDLIRLQGYRSVYALVSQYLRDERLRTIFSFHPLLIGGNPFRASAIYCLIAALENRWGVHFAMGGTGALVSGLVDLIEGQGSEIRYETEVESIIVDAGVARGVRLADGEAIPGPTRVSCRRTRAVAGAIGGLTARPIPWVCFSGISGRIIVTTTSPITPS